MFFIIKGRLFLPGNISHRALANLQLLHITKTMEANYARWLSAQITIMIFITT